MYFLSSLQPIFIVSFLGWIQMLWPLIYFRITFYYGWGTFLCGWCFSVFWYVLECWRAYSSCLVIYGRGFLSPCGISLLLLMWGNWTWDMGSTSSSQLAERVLIPLTKNETETLGFFFFSFLNWGWKGLVYVMQASPLSYSPCLIDAFSRKKENLKNKASSIFLAPSMEPLLAPIPIHGLFLWLLSFLCLKMKKKYV